MSNVTFSADDETRELLDGVANKSRFIRDAITLTTQLDLTAATAAAFAELQGFSDEVTEPLSAASRLLRSVLRDGLAGVYHLHALKWTSREVLATIEVMMGALYTHGMAVGPQIASDMKDAECPGDIEPDRWDKLAWDVGYDEGVARCLLDVARLYWAAPESSLTRLLKR